MTRIKSRYRTFRDGGAVTADPSPIAVPPDAADVPASTDSDDAAIAFREQISNLNRAEEMQRQRPPQRSSRAVMLEGLRQQGLSETAITFLAENPAIADAPALADQAAKAARAEGHEPDTPGFFQSVRSHFAELAAEDDRGAIASAMETASRYSGATSAEPIAEMAALERDKFNRSAAMVSAPVSREAAVSWSGQRPAQRPGQVRLSVAQREAAKIAGISETEYAIELLNFEEAKRRDPQKYGGG